jgi:aryl-alcohol dehydrogenase-like predicted oxidoreductase
MQYANLGRSGLQVSRICLGGNSWGSKGGGRQWSVFDAEGSQPFLKRALDLGINFFDTAPSYSDGRSEEVLGKCLVGSIPRDELILLSKVGFPNSGPNCSCLSRKHIFSSIDSTLRRLCTDYVDLYVIHRFDPLTPIEETMLALHDVVRAGKARYLGASTMAARQFIRMHLFAKANRLTHFIEMQNFYNLLYREDEREIIPFCCEEGIGLTPYSPLARGILSGNRAADGSGQSERARADIQRTAEFYRDHQPAILDAIRNVATAQAVKPAQVAFAWLLSQNAVTAPIVGPTKIEHIDDAVAALSIKLSADQIASLQSPYQPRTPLN